MSQYIVAITKYLSVLTTHTLYTQTLASLIVIIPLPLLFAKASVTELDSVRYQDPRGPRQRLDRLPCPRVSEGPRQAAGYKPE